MEYLNFLRTRISLLVMQEFCRKYDLPTSNGWDKLGEKLANEAEISSARANEIDELLAKIFKETLPLGKRAVQVYKIPATAARAIAQYFKDMEPEVSGYMGAFPRPLKRAQLNALDEEAYVCGTSIGKRSATLFLCIKRMFEEKTPKTPNELGHKAVTQFGWADYDEIILVKRQPVQCYDMVRVDEISNTIEIRTEEHGGVSSEIALLQIKNKVNHLFEIKFGYKTQLLDPLNLFPAIRSIYDDAEEGVVVELGFTTETGSAKHEKMRRGLDLREELFHVGGKNAVHGVFSPFRIGVRWHEAENRELGEVLLPGSARDLANDPPLLDHMLMNGALSEKGIRTCIGKVIQHANDDS